MSGIIPSRLRQLKARNIGDHFDNRFFGIPAFPVPRDNLPRAPPKCKFIPEIAPKIRSTIRIYRHHQRTATPDLPDYSPIHMDKINCHPNGVIRTFELKSPCPVHGNPITYPRRH